MTATPQPPAVGSSAAWQPSLTPTADRAPLDHSAADARRGWIVLLLALVLRLVAMAFYEGPVNDGVGRTELAARWLADAAPFWTHLGSQVWGDGNYLLPALPQALGGGPFWAVRMLYALVGASNVWALWLLGRRTLGARAAWIAALILALNPYHVALSVQTGIGETPYISLVLLGLAVAWPLRERPGVGRAFAAGLLFAAAAAFRFEAMLWAALTGVWVALVPLDRRLPVLRDPRRWSAFVALGVGSATYPAALMLRWYQLYGDPLYYRTATVNYQQFFANGQHATWPNYIFLPFAGTFWLTSAVAVLTPVVALLAAVGVREGLRRTALAPLVALLALLTLVFSYFSIRLALPLEYRYGMALYAAMLLLAVAGMQALARRHPRLTPARLGALVAASVLLTYGAYTAFAFGRNALLARRLGLLSPVQPAQFATRDLARWITARPAAEQRVLLSACAMSAYLTLELRDLRARDVIGAANIYKDGWHVRDRADFTRYFADTVATYRYAAFPTECTGLGLTDGTVPDPFEPPAPNVPYTVAGVTFRPAAQLPGLWVYRVERSAAPR